MSPDPSTHEHLDQLLEEAVEAVNAGDSDTARALTDQVLAADAGNPEANQLLASINTSGEVRRLTIMFIDLVGSTELSGRMEPELYRAIVGRYLGTCRSVVEERYDGHSPGTRGDGMLAVFGFPRAHEDDPARAVNAALDVIEAVDALSAELRPETGEKLSVRIGVHRGLVYLDTDESEIYGIGANVAARLQELAEPGTVVISDELARLVDGGFELDPKPAKPVKGIEEPLAHSRVVGVKATDARVVGRWRTPLVNRIDELARLRTLWRHRRDGPAAELGALVHGEPGMGKSRLVGALVDEVRADGGSVVVLTGSPMHTDTGLHPIRRWLEATTGTGGQDAETRLRLLRVHLLAVGLDVEETLPLLAPVVGLDPGEAGYRAVAAEARLLSDMITDAVVRLLTAEFGGSSGVLVADDVQWFDDPTRMALERFVASDPSSILTVFVARGHALTVPARFEVIPIEPLDRDELDQLASALGAAGLSGARRATLLTRSDGVPLYLEELVRAELALADPGAIGVTGGARPAGGVDAAGIPEALYEPLVARLHATAGAVEVATAAAAIGRDVDRDTLARVVELSAEDLEETLRSLLGALILERVEGDLFRFRHELLRDVAYELMPPSGRRRTHARVAGALVARTADGAAADWRAIADHHERAGQPRDAARCYQRAAEEARNRGGLGEARSHMSRAIELVADLDDPADRRREIDLRLRRGFLAIATEGNASTQAALDYERCMELALAQPEGPDMVSTLYALWAHYASRGDLERAQRLTDLVRDMEIVRTDAAMFAANTGALGTLAFFRGEFDWARLRLEECLAGVVSAPDLGELSARWFIPNDMRAITHLNAGLARWATGDPEGSDQQVRLAMRTAERLPFPQGPFSSAYICAYGGWMAIEQGALARADELIGRLAGLAAEHGFDFWAVIAQSLKVMLEAERGRRADPARAPHALAEELAGLIGVIGYLETRLFLPANLTHLARILLEAGDHEAAAARLDESLTLSHETGAHFYDAETLRVRAHLAGDRQEVDAGLRDALRLAIAQRAVPFRLRTAVDLHGVSDDHRELEAALTAFAPDASCPELDDARAHLAGGG